MASLPLFIKTNDGEIVKALWSAGMILFGIVFTIGAIQNMQYFYFKGEDLTIKSLFGTVVTLNAKQVHVYIETLPVVQT